MADLLDRQKDRIAELTGKEKGSLHPRSSHPRKKTVKNLKAGDIGEGGKPPPQLGPEDLEEATATLTGEQPLHQPGQGGLEGSTAATAATATTAATGGGQHEETTEQPTTPEDEPPAPADVIPGSPPHPQPLSAQEWAEVQREERDRSLAGHQPLPGMHYRRGWEERVSQPRVEEPDPVPFAHQAEQAGPQDPPAELPTTEEVPPASQLVLLPPGPIRPPAPPMAGPRPPRPFQMFQNVQAPFAFGAGTPTGTTPGLSQSGTPASKGGAPRKGPTTRLASGKGKLKKVVLDFSGTDTETGEDEGPPDGTAPGDGKGQHGQSSGGGTPGMGTRCSRCSKPPGSNAYIPTACKFANTPGHHRHCSRDRFGKSWKACAKDVLAILVALRRPDLFCRGRELTLGDIPAADLSWIPEYRPGITADEVFQNRCWRCEAEARNFPTTAYWRTLTAEMWGRYPELRRPFPDEIPLERGSAAKRPREDEGPDDPAAGGEPPEHCRGGQGGPPPPPPPPPPTA
ncbi:hypothetical protein BSKO_13189 [Bryopsis sp. KO-2023]|nr:hypothetical protein BSKO_13189 [Bryopsis sp. KO-2023]